MASSRHGANGAPPPPPAPPTRRFVDALVFEGPKPGYFFGTGDEGTGYYREVTGGVVAGSMPPPAPRRPRAAAAAAASDDDDGDGDDGDPNANNTNKRPRLAPPSRGEELLARAEAEAGGEGALADLDAAAPTDARGARRLLLALERRVADNVRLRARHPDAPMRFLDSEVDIMGALRALAGLAASPELYGLLYKAGGGGAGVGGAAAAGTSAAADADPESSSSSSNKHLECVLGLLAHENADIGCEVLALLQELTDTEEGGASAADAGADAARQRAAARSLARAVVAAGGLELAGQRATTLDEAAPEEAQGIAAALGLVENLSVLLGARGSLAVCRRAPALLTWMLVRVRRKAAGGGGAGGGPDPIKLSAAEVLAAMLMGAEGGGGGEDDEEDEEAAGGGGGGEEGGSSSAAAATSAAAAVAEAVVAAGGVDALLRAAAPFRARDPSGLEEAELLENAFGALAALLSAPGAAGARARARFLDEEGVDLCVLMLRSRRPSRAGALRALDFAATRCPAVCRAIVERGGLGPLFGLFMGRSKLKEEEGGERGGSGNGGGEDGRKMKKKKKKKKARMALDRDGERELEERTVSLLASLFAGLTAEAEAGAGGAAPAAGAGAAAPAAASAASAAARAAAAAALLDRLAAKFVEGEHEKLDRLVELLMRHTERVERAERAVLEAQQQEEQEEQEEGGRGGGGGGGPETPAAEAERALARQEAGEYPAQCCACVAAFLWASGDAPLRSRLLSLLHLRGRTLQLLREGVCARGAALEAAAEAEAAGATGAAGSAGAGAGAAGQGEAGGASAVGSDAAERARELRALAGALASLGE